MTAPEREALVKALRDEMWLDVRVKNLLAQAADLIEALSKAPAVTVTEEMLSLACEAYKGERHMVDRGAMMSALQAALKSTTPQTGSI